jgi:hemerythrin superfamily protein
LSPDTRRRVYRALDATNNIHILNRYKLDHKGIEELIESIPSGKLAELVDRAYWGTLSEIFAALYKCGRTNDLLFKAVKLAVGAENSGKEKTEKLANVLKIIEDTDKNAAKVIAELVAKFQAA